MESCVAPGPRQPDGWFLEDEIRYLEEIQADPVTNCPDRRESLEAYLRQRLDDRDGGPMLRWEMLVASGVDKDEVIYQAACQTFLARSPLEKSIGYFRSYFFYWFLRRYELGRARAVLFRSSTEAGWLQAMLSYAARFSGVLLLAFAVAVHLMRPPLEPDAGFLTSTWYLLPYFGLLVLFGPWLVFWSERPWNAFLLFLQSLIPRLGGMAVATLLFLLSQRDVIQLLSDSGNWGLTLLGFLAANLYLAFEAAKRVAPLPGLSRLLRSVTSITSLGLCHAMTICAVGMALLPATFGIPTDPLGFSCLAVNLFSLGLVLHIIWAEEPVTMPL